MSKGRIAVAMSGGVDSTVAAYLAQRAGYEVTGIFLRMEKDSIADAELYRSCADAGIELIEHDCSENFYKKVLLSSASEYVCGRTPNPCCQCNKVLKFAELLISADKLGIEKVWTGHYVRLISENGIFRLAKGVDVNKDQSYFLYRLTQEELSRVGFPLGELSKTEVRQIAAEAGLACAVRKDSQDACFQIAGECCGETLRRRCDLPVKSGWFMYKGKRISRHEGIHRYTLGQRQGLNVALGVPAYVRSISDGGDIELTTDQNELMSERFTVKDISWQNYSMPEKQLSVRVRYRSPGVDCRLEKLPDGRLAVYPVVPQRAVTPGQAAVFYDGEYVVGGGIIDDV